MEETVNENVGENIVKSLCKHTHTRILSYMTNLVAIIALMFAACLQQLLQCQCCTQHNYTQTHIHPCIYATCHSKKLNYF